MRRIVGFVAALALVGLAACGSSKPGDGSPGAAGTSGAAGSSGAAGTTGVAGTTGTAGTGANAGTTGTAGTTGDAGTTGTAGTTGGAGSGGAGTGGACVPVVEQHTEEGARIHVPCTPVPTYGTKPPSSGNHYAIWADYKTYDKPVPWGHLMHSMEHGAVIIVYNCPAGCPDEVAAAQAMIDALPFPLDPEDIDVATGSACVAPTKRRVILAPDPTLDVRWAAAAWTWTLRSSCFDAAAFQKFTKDHYAKMPENFCNELHEPFCTLP